MYYPINLNIEGKRCLVIGGGKVAFRKVKALLKTGAIVKVVSPQFIPQFRKLKNLILVRRTFHIKDIQNIFLVIIATNDSKFNQKISELSKTKSILVNVVDAPKLCNFIVPSVIRRGDLTISISTAGYSPALSKEIREELEKIYPKYFGNFVRALHNARKRILEKVSDSAMRKKLLRKITNHNVINILRKKGIKTAISNIEKIMGSIS